MALDFTAMREEQRRVQSMTHRGIRNWELKENSQNRGRLLAPWPGSPALGFMTFKHFHTFLDPKVTSCYEQMYPQSTFKCPICAIILSLQQRGVDASRVGAECHPCMNVIDRLTPNQESNPFFWEARLTPYNTLMSIALNNQIDLTSDGDGYDFIVVPKTTTSNNRTRTTYEVQIVPTGATPLVPAGVDINLGKRWVEQAYNIPSMYRMPDWNGDDGRREWQKLTNVAAQLERYYSSALNAQTMVVPGFTPPAPQPQFAPPAPYPPQQFAPPVPVAPPAPPAAPPQQFAPPAPPQSQFTYQPQPHQQFTPPTPPQQPQQQFTPPTPPQPQQYAPPQPQQQFAPQPAGPTPPWEAPRASAPPPQTQQFAPPAPAAPQTAQSGPSMVNSSADQMPPCYGKSYKDQTVSYKNIVGGWSDSDQDPHRAMRCSTCSHEMGCKSAVLQVYPTDYVS